MTRAPMTPPYPQGFYGILQQMESRRAPLEFGPREELPPLEIDLEEMAQARVPAPEDDPLQAIKPGSSNLRKFLTLRVELAGRSELTVLHGLLISHLRKSSQPAQTAPLFHRLWAEQSQHLLQELNPRWQVSAITTFGDHGMTPQQRLIGRGVSVLLDTMKLYESERRFSGLSGNTAFNRRSRTGTLPMQMDAYSLQSGGLDVNLLGRLWRDAEQDDVAGPLAHHLLKQVIDDPYTVFRRLKDMSRTRQRKQALKDIRKRHAAGSEEAPASPDPVPVDLMPPNLAPVGDVPKRQSGMLRWGVVCTTDAAPETVQNWAAHYLDLGADRVFIYLDSPNPHLAELMGRHPHITLTSCDADYWQTHCSSRPESPQARSDANATHCLSVADTHFLGHFEVSDFLISKVPVARALGFVPGDMAAARMHPVELLIPEDGPACHFKRTATQVDLPSDTLKALYPHFGATLPDGFIGDTRGKVFARTGIDATKLERNRLIFNGAEVSNMTELPRMVLAHAPMRDFTQFQQQAQELLSEAQTDAAEPAPEHPGQSILHDVLRYLINTEGQSGLHAFFQEVCTARPALLKALAKYGMLVTHDLALADKVARIFAASADAHPIEPAIIQEIASPTVSQPLEDNGSSSSETHTELTSKAAS